MPPQTRRQAYIASLPTPPGMFPQFSRLYPELQNMIWELTLPGPQVHSVKGLSVSPDPSDEQHYLFLRSPPLPVAFSVTYQSRYVASLHMRKFYLNTAPVTQTDDAYPYGYCYPEADVLHLENCLTHCQPWNIGCVPFTTISFCIQAHNRILEDPHMLPDIDNLTSTSSIIQNLILVTIQDLPGFAPHTYCRKMLAAGHPSMEQQLPRTCRTTTFKDKLKRWESDVTRQMIAAGVNAPKIKVTSMPLACDCPGVELRMGRKVRSQEVKKTKEAQRRGVAAWLKTQAQQKRNQKIA